MKTETKPTPPQKFYIYSISHSPANGCALWWRPLCKGYTTDLNCAGVYTAEYVHANPDYYDNGVSTAAIPCELADAKAETQRTVPNLDALAVAKSI